MRILTDSPQHYGRHQSFLKQKYRLRAAVFGGRLEWDVSVTDGEDQYDDLKPTYVLTITEGGLVAGCVRLLAGSLSAERLSFEQVCSAGYRSIPHNDGAPIRSAA
ncbi:acyl-homoserine-lactone synthase [Mesorhizobium sp.]|uniref:acyl-homoserine-lactone synthase n=1 Tax=Mesorhizobium sp. TaxID=1871066 RepID=UPI000FE60D36|nr:acyl-homoserine-lactone synthase [Mesorhizobium sp.]RWK27524.1 MAG: hypothetical protein EOR44_26975 [Mesorhizobium sp.]